MLRFSLRTFLWLMSIFVFIWLLVCIFKNRECPHSEALSEDNYDTYGANTLPDNKTIQMPKRIYSYNRELSLLFIGGITGSGLELMRSTLDQNPYIRCSSETEIITNLIIRRGEWTNSKIEKERLVHAGMSDFIIDEAVSAFILEAILKQGKIANLLCNKDSVIFNHVRYISRLFPNAKFLLMIRDARSTVDHLVYNRIYYNNVNTNNYYEDTLKGWNKVTMDFYNDCKFLGSDVCKIVYYERLILETRKTLNEIYKFLNLEKQFGKKDNLKI